MIIAGDYGKAMDVAKKQVEDGAHVIDINVDDEAFGWHGGCAEVCEDCCN
jgi:cobalamin-dependent methionine synthase I